MFVQLETLVELNIFVNALIDCNRKFLNFEKKIKFLNFVVNFNMMSDFPVNWRSFNFAASNYRHLVISLI